MADLKVSTTPSCSYVAYSNGWEETYACICRDCVRCSCAAMLEYAALMGSPMRPEEIQELTASR